MKKLARDAAIDAGAAVVLFGILAGAVELFDLMPYLSDVQRIGYCLALAIVAGPKGVRRSLVEGPSKLAGIILFLGVLHFLLMCAGEGVDLYQNHFNLGERIGLFGILTLAAGLVIVTGNIDLSIGSVVGLCTTAMCLLVVNQHWNPSAAVAVVLALGALIGLVNGLLVTYLRVQAFVVTLCGMFVYRSLARFIANDQATGLGAELRDWADFLNSRDGLMSVYLMILLVLLAAAAVMLHLSVAGRCFYAIGSNERAARFSGITTGGWKVLAFVLCSTLTAFYSVLHVFKYPSIQPSAAGNMFELTAIAGAVLGGLSLRGGDGTVLGMLIGTSIIVVLPNLTAMWGVPETLEGVVIGAALLLGATVDEFLRRRRASRKE